MVELLTFILATWWNFLGTLVLMVFAAGCLSAVVSRMPPIFAMNHFNNQNKN